MNSRSFNRFLSIKFNITFITADVNLSPSDGVLDGAAGFVGVRAIGESARGNVRTELDEAALEFGGIDVPEFELAEAGRIDDVAAEFQADEFGVGGGVFPFAGPIGNLGDAEVQAGLDGVQEGALADPALTRKGGRARERISRNRGTPRPSSAEVGIVS